MIHFNGQRFLGPYSWRLPPRETAGTSPASRRSSGLPKRQPLWRRA
jgi:hypothetical protein